MGTLMQLRGLSRLRRVWRRLKRSLAPQQGALILCYHRVAEMPQSPRRLWVSPQRFAEQLDALTRHFVPLSLSELAERLRAGKVPDKAVVVTFDDGYADNLWNARPLLERFGVPATVFVTTGLVGTDREFYWDELERLLLSETVTRGNGETVKQGSEEAEKRGNGEGRGEQELCLEMGGQVRRWRLVTPEERLKAYHEIHDEMTSMPPEQREAILKQLRIWAGADERGRSTHRLMTVEELATISRDGLVEIGAHTVNHPDLSALPPERQQWEIETSKRQLEEWLGRLIRWFAYPYGRGSAVTRQLVQEAGFEAACSMSLGSTTNRSDPFWLPRIFVENWDGDELMRRLREV